MKTIKSRFSLTSTVLGFVGAISLPTMAIANPERIAELKQQMRSIAIENLGRRDNLADSRSQLEPLATELATFTTAKLAEDDLPALVGAWKEIFSDDVEPEPPGFKTDRDGTYQIITDKGYFYNFGELKGPGPLRFLGVLRGVYSPAEEFLNIEFTKVSVRLSGLKATENLTELVTKIESGKEFTIVPPGSNKFPKGPVGAKGNIRNLYIDSDFRVATGSNFADGKYDLYVLDKVTKPIRYK
jgi:hypothetical protein